MENLISYSRFRCIGAGCSGLTTAKALLEVGLKPHIFEQSSQLGGIWGSNPPFSWPSMRSNISKHSCTFSDFSYPDLTTSSYPHASQLAEYLKAYARQFIDPEHIFLGHRVTSVKRELQKEKWSVCWEDGLKKRSGDQLFDFVVISTGYSAVPSIPSIPGLETFPEGKVIHSSRYQNPSTFKGKKVAVVGAGFSGVEIAADLAIHADVFHIFPRPFYVLPRHLPLTNSDGPPVFLPMELVLHRRTNRTSFDEVSLLDADNFEKSHKRIQAFVGDQSDLHPALHIQDVNSPVMVSISDHYAELVRSQKITIVKGKLMSMEGTTLTITSNITIPDVDTIIMSTGYRSSLPFLDPNDLDTISFEPKDPITPLLLYRNMIHPDVPNMAFVGMYRGPYWGVVELQARYVAALFSNRLRFPSDDILRDGIKRELAIRNFRPRPQFPHPDNTGLISSLAKDLDITPLIDPKRPILVGEIVTPGQFACPSDISPRRSSWVDSSKLLLDSLTTTVQCSEAGTRCIAPAVFRALHGCWKLKRLITSKLQTLPSGTFTGTAVFIPRLSADKDVSVSSEIDEYLYREEGILRLESTSTELPAQRSYLYRLIDGSTGTNAKQSETHHIDVFFTKGNGAVDNFFHSIRFVDPARETVKESTKQKLKWKATGEHLCNEDMYMSEYWFDFDGVHVTSFGFVFDVQGPKKNYRAVSEFTR